MQKVPLLLEKYLVRPSEIRMRTLCCAIAVMAAEGGEGAFADSRGAEV